MTRAIIVRETGGPGVMEMAETPLSAPQSDEILIHHEAIALNFIDIQHRTGRYPLPLPTGLGMEAAGVVTAVGEGVTDLRPGDRVVYLSDRPGAYADDRIIARKFAARLPDNVSCETAASCFSRGVLAWHLAAKTHPIQSGETVAVLAAAGGLGGLLTQLAKNAGARVVGIVGSESKLHAAQESGCDLALTLDDPQAIAKICEFSGGQGADVVYDSVGAASWDLSRKSLRPQGKLVCFGNASGPVTGITPFADLALPGSLTLSWVLIKDLLTNPSDMRDAVAGLFTEIVSQKLRIDIRKTVSLSDVAQAHADFESRATIGLTVIKP